MTETQPLLPPIARKQHTETLLHGTVLTDDYAWLREKENPEVTAYLEAENAYAQAVMAPLDGLRADLYQEMLSHVKQTDVSVPYQDGAWWYYTRTEEGRQYAIHCRTHGSPNATEDTPEQIVLDGNASWPRACPSSPLAPPTSLATAAGWPTPPTQPASANTPCISRT